jgi:hypothetical protein
MIPFFRKIRYRLAKDNQFFKYSRYAIGEIVLVVVGILIALQINNWNENRKSNNVKHNYYNQIVVDLNKEIENINSRIIFLDSCITTSDRYFKYTETPNLETIKVFEELSKVELTFRYLAFNTNTIQTLESTGDIKLMQEKIRNSLIELKRIQEQTSRVAKGNYEIYLNAQQKALQLGYGRLLLKTPKANGLEIKNNIPEIILTLEGGLIIKIFTDKLVKNALLDMLNEIKKIKELINQDIE